MSIATAARRLAKLLAASGHKIVFAESCTGGLVSASLTRIPGISAYHCGGMIAYRNETKAAYFGINSRTLKRPGPVSERAAQLMADGVFQQTPEATVAVAVTGHLGPAAPANLDGVVFLAVRACHGADRAEGLQTHNVLQLELPDASRDARQRMVVEAALRFAGEIIEHPPEF
jgi:nicotinamide-nucleotide amidase